jgi:membrane protein
MGSIDAVVKRLLRLRLTRAFFLFSDHRGGLLAAAITYRMLFAVFASVLLGFSISSFWLSSRSDLWDALVETVDQVIPGLIGTGSETNALISIDDVLDQQIGFASAGGVGAVALVIALLGAVGNVRLSLRTIAGTRQDTSNALIMKAVDLLFALSIGVLVAASAIASFLGSSFVDLILEWIDFNPGGLAEFVTRAGTVFVTFVLDAVIIAWLFWLQSGVRPGIRAMLPGALIGGAGLVVLQQASGLFVGGANNNPLFGVFTSLIALLLWFNFSAQVVLIACAYIVTTVDEQNERVGTVYGVETFAQRTVRAAERDVIVAQDALVAARDAEHAEREKQAARREK